MVAIRLDGGLVQEVAAGPPGERRQTLLASVRGALLPGPDAALEAMAAAARAATARRP